MVTAVKRPAGETRGKVAAGPNAGQCHRASSRPYSDFQLIILCSNSTKTNVALAMQPILARAGADMLERFPPLGRQREAAFAR